jgi:hypothetical protein
MACFEHSASQAEQIDRQRVMAASSRSLPRAANPARSRQASEQSMSQAMQAAMALGSSSCRHADAQWLQAAAQALQASMRASFMSMEGVSVESLFR